MYIFFRTADYPPVNVFCNVFVVKSIIAIRSNKTIRLKNLIINIYVFFKIFPVIFYTQIPCMKKHYSKILNGTSFNFYCSIFPILKFSLSHIKIFVGNINASRKRSFAVNHNNFPVVPVVIMNRKNRKNRRKNLGIYAKGL